MAQPAPATLQPTIVTPDPLAGLSNRVGAILDLDTPAPRVMIVEDDHGVSNTSVLGLGDEYRDGWRLTEVAATAFTLDREGEARRIAVNMTGGGQAARAPVVALNIPPPSAPVTATPSPAGGGRGGQAAPARGNTGRGQTAAGGRGGAATAGRGQAAAGNFGLFVGGQGLTASPVAPAPPGPPPPPPSPPPPPAPFNAAPTSAAPANTITTSNGRTLVLMEGVRLAPE